MAYDSSGIGSTGSGGRRKKSRVGPRQIAALVFLVLAVILVVENTKAKVRLRLIIPEETIHLWIVVVVALVLGLLAGLLFLHRGRRGR